MLIKMLPSEPHQYWYYFPEGEQRPVQIPKHTLPAPPFKKFIKKEQCEKWIKEQNERKVAAVKRLSIPSSNFLKLKNHYKLTQEMLGVQLGIKRATAAAYLEGRAELQLAVIKTIFEQFNIPKEKLYEFLFDDNFEIV